MEIPVEYLLGASQAGLKDLLLKKLTLSANLRKQLIELAKEWAERKAEALLIEWLDEHGEELLMAAAAPAAHPASAERARSDGAAKKALLSEASPAPPMRYEFWRSQQRHVRRRRTAA